MAAQRFFGLTHRHLTVFPAWLTVTEDAVEARPTGMSAWAVRRAQTSEVAFRRRLLGSVLEVHPDDYREAPLLVFRPLNRARLEAELRRSGWLD